MNERLEKAIEKLIYWRKAYVDSRTKFINTGDAKKCSFYRHRSGLNLLHLLSSAEYLTQIYEEETGKKVTTYSNLPDFKEINEREI